MSVHGSENIYYISIAYSAFSKCFKVISCVVLRKTWGVVLRKTGETKSKQNDWKKHDIIGLI